MDMLKKFFPYSFGAKDITNLIVKIIVYIVVGAVIGLLRGAGVDMESPPPVNQALALFGQLLDEMDKLMEA